MKTKCPESEQLMRLIDGSAPRRERTATKKHLSQCSACLREYDALAGIGNLLVSLRRPEPAHGLLDQYHSGLSARFGNGRSGSILQDSISRFILHPAPVIRLAQAAALLVVGLALGWTIHRASGSSQVVEYIYSPSIARQIDTYFNESEMWLLDVMNLPRNGDLGMDDWSMTRNDAERLLRKTIAIRELTRIGQDPKLDGYLNGLEMLLMELINGPAADRSDIVEQIKQTINEFNLLLRTELLQENLRVSQQI